MVGERKFAIFSQARRRRLAVVVWFCRRSMRVRSLNSIAFHYVVGKRENQPRTKAGGGGRGGGGIAMSLALCVSIQGLMGIEEEFCA